MKIQIILPVVIYVSRETVAAGSGFASEVSGGEAVTVKHQMCERKLGARKVVTCCIFSIVTICCCGDELYLCVLVSHL